MEKDVSDSNSGTKLLNQTPKLKADLINLAIQRYATRIKKSGTPDQRKRPMEIDSDSEDI